MTALARQTVSASASSAPVPTPCLGVCELDAESRLCRGCARNADEIAIWQHADDMDKAGIWALLPERRAGLAMSAYRLPWSAGDIAAMIGRSLHRRWGRWVLGVPGASVPFKIAPDDDAEIISQQTEITAITSRGALRLLKHEKTIAVAFGDLFDDRGPEAIGLILPRGRVTLRQSDGLTHAGSDEDAICPQHRQAELFDLGLSPMLAARFCLRTHDRQTADHLSSLIGASGQSNAGTIAELAAASKLHFIAETGLGRAECFVPLTDDVAGPIHAETRELPEGFELKPVFAPCALFYPDSRRPAEAFVDGPF